MKLTTARLKRLIKEELNKLLEIDNEPVTYSNVYPGIIGKIFDMIISSDRGEPDYYDTRAQILILVDSLGEEQIEKILETLEKEIKNQFDIAKSAGKLNHPEISEPRYKLMDLKYDIEQMKVKGYEVVFKKLKQKTTASEDPNWLDV